MPRQQTVKPILIPVEYGPQAVLDAISSSLMPDIHKKLGVHLRDWQVHAFETLRKGEDLIIKAGTGAGKTAAILSMLVTKTGATILVIVPLTSIEMEVVSIPLSGADTVGSGVTKARDQGSSGLRRYIRAGSGAVAQGK